MDIKQQVTIHLSMVVVNMVSSVNISEITFDRKISWSEMDSVCDSKYELSPFENALIKVSGVATYFCHIVSLLLTITCQRLVHGICISI